DARRDHRLTLRQRLAQRLGDEREDLLREGHETQEDDEHREHRLHDARAKLDEMRDQRAFGKLFLLLIASHAAHLELPASRISSPSVVSTTVSSSAESSSAAEPSASDPADAARDSVEADGAVVSAPATDVAAAAASG